jgi:tetratricopeptide (TPR) repeat protein
MPDAHREDIDKLESLYAEHPEGRIFTHLAEAYRKAGELDRATEVLEAGLQRHPDYSSAHVVLGRVLMDQDRTGDAEAAFRRVLELDNHNLVALRSLGDLARSDGRDQEALQHYSRLLDVEPADDQVRELVETLEAQAVEPESLSWSEPPAWDLDQPPAHEDDATDAAAPHAEAEAEAEEHAGWEPAGWESHAQEHGADAPSAEEPTGGERLEQAGESPATDDGEWSPFQSYDLPRAEEDDEDAGREDDAALPPGQEMPMSDPGLMTETIAQVYARQGLYDRAADVYRELVRSRPDDSGLRDRLDEMEALAASGGARPAATEAGADVAPLSGLESHDVEADTGLTTEAASEVEHEPAHGTEPATDDWDLYQETPEVEAFFKGAPFPGGHPSGEGSADAGHGSGDEESASEASTEWAPGDQPDEDQPDEERSVWLAEDWSGETRETPYAWAEPASEPEVEDSSPPIRGYLGSLLGWQPSSERAGEEGEGEVPGGEPESGSEDEEPGPEGHTEDEADDDDDLDTFRTWLESLKQ